MADKTVYVDGTTSTGHYASLSAAITGEVAANPNLVTMDGILHIEISITTAETAKVVVSGFTTDATRYVHIYTTAAARHSGVYSSSKYRIEVANEYGVMEIGVNCKTVVDGLQLVLTGDGLNQASKGVFMYGAGTIANCLIKGAANNSYAFEGIRCSADVKDRYIINTVVYNIGTNSGSYGMQLAGGAGANTYLYHCTVGNGGSSSPYGIRNAGAGTVVAKNSYSGNNPGDDWDGVFTATTCASSDTSEAEITVQSVPYSTATFASVTGDVNFQLAGTESGLYDAGTDVSGDSLPDISGDFLDKDIAGTTRTRWDIGAFEYAAAGGPTYRPRVTLIL